MATVQKFHFSAILRTCSRIINGAGNKVAYLGSPPTEGWTKQIFARLCISFFFRLAQNMNAFCTYLVDKKFEMHPTALDLLCTFFMAKANCIAIACLEGDRQ